VKFEIVGEIEQIETIASGRGVDVRAMLRKVHGKGRWRKRKGVATIRLRNRALRRVEFTLVRGARRRTARLQDRGLFGPAMKRISKQFALCLDNEGNEASLIVGKVYRVVADARAAKDNLVRVVDESGEDYLFARTQFAFVDLPESVRRKLRALQKTG
jgi:hypothetical protein